MTSLPGTELGYRAWGGSQPMDVRAPDGTVYRGLNGKFTDGLLYYVVFKITTAGVVSVAWRSGPGAGQGSLVCDARTGDVIATWYTAQGDGAASDSAVVGNVGAIGGGAYTLPVAYDAALKWLVALLRLGGLLK